VPCDTGREITSEVSAVRRFAILTLAWFSAPASVTAQPTDALCDDTAKGLKKSATYYREKVASHGGYVYYYFADLKERWGEGRATADTIFVQPPGTPTVGMASCVDSNLRRSRLTKMKVSEYRHPATESSSFRNNSTS